MMSASKAAESHKPSANLSAQEKRSREIVTHELSVDETVVASSDVAEHVESLAAVLEMVTRMATCIDLDAAADQLADALRGWLRCDRVDLFWQSVIGKPCRLIGHSGKSAIEIKDHDAMRSAAAEEILTRGGVTDSRSLGKSAGVALLAVKQYGDAIDAKRMLGVSLSRSRFPNDAAASDSGVTVAGAGAMLLRFDRHLAEAEAERVRRRLEVCRDPIRVALDRAVQSQPTCFTRQYRAWVGPRGIPRPAKRRFLAAFVVLALVGVMMIPVPYQVVTTCTLEPVGRRYVAAPLDGVLEEVTVRPGDDVVRGEVLARLDPQEIEIELAGKRAEWQRLTQEHKGLVATHRFAESKLIALEKDRLQSEIDVLEYQRERLTVIAPVQGTVIDGEWHQSRGAPVELGETLFEIAPPGVFHLELAIDEVDVRQVRPGMPLRVRLDALPGTVVTSEIDEVHPRAEIRDDQNVFLALARVEDPDGRLRPGMRGTGRIRGDARALGWNLFHKAYYRFLAFLGV